MTSPVPDDIRALALELYETLFRVGKHQHGRVPGDPLALIEQTLCKLDADRATPRPEGLGEPVALAAELRKHLKAGNLKFNGDGSWEPTFGLSAPQILFTRIYDYLRAAPSLPAKAAPSGEVGALGELADRLRRAAPKLMTSSAQKLMIEAADALYTADAVPSIPVGVTVKLGLHLKMWASVSRDELDGKLRWMCSAEGDKGEVMSLEVVELDASTFAVGTILQIWEPNK